MTREQKLALIRKIRSQVESKYKKLLIVGIVVALVVGIVLGMLSCMTGVVDPNLLSGPTPVPTAIPTPEPTPEPQYYPGDRELPIADGEIYTFDMEVASTGTPRYAVGESDTPESYMTANVSIAAARLMTPRYFEDKYGREYKLVGDEAGVQVDIKLNSASGASVPFCPQDAMVITLESEDGVVDGGYQLMDGEISGNYGVTIAPGNVQTYFKRFTWNASAPAKYLVVNYYMGGVSKKVYFELSEDAVVQDVMKSDEQIAAENSANAPESANPGTDAAPTGERLMPEITANPNFPTMAQNANNRKNLVEKLQQRLIELGYLTGRADGDFGPATEEAVKKAQAALGLEANGVADPLFLTLLLEDQMPKASEASSTATAAPSTAAPSAPPASAAPADDAGEEEPLVDDAGDEAGDGEEEDQVEF